MINNDLTYLFPRVRVGTAGLVQHPRPHGEVTLRPALATATQPATKHTNLELRHETHHYLLVDPASVRRVGRQSIAAQSEIEDHPAIPAKNKRPPPCMCLSLIRIADILFTGEKKLERNQPEA